MYIFVVYLTCCLLSNCKALTMYITYLQGPFICYAPDVSQSVYSLYISPLTFDGHLVPLGVCHFFTLSTKITLKITPCCCRHYDVAGQPTPVYSKAPSSSHCTQEWQTLARMLTLCCRRVKNKINCVTSLGIFRSNYLGLHLRLYWSQIGLHTDLSGRAPFLCWAA